MDYLCLGKEKIISVLLAMSILLSFFRLFIIEVDSKDYSSAAKKMLEGFFSMEESIDISEFGIMPEELGGLFSSVIKNEPYLFFVDRNMSYSYERRGAVISVRPRYKMSRAEMEKAVDFCRQRITEMAKKACGGEGEKAIFLHDLICENFEYDEELKNDNIYDFFLTGKGTCQAYTLAYMAVLRNSGIDSVFVASDTIGHIWNLVKIDGEWYHADLTWDDGEQISRRHFLLSDKIARERGHKDWYSTENITCVSDTYANVDFDLLLYFSSGSGDADHNGQVEILDLMLLRGVGAKGVQICKKCADLDLDGNVEDSDTPLLRKRILEQYLQDN